MTALACGATRFTSHEPQRQAAGEVFGSNVAEAALIRASLRCEESLSWDFWVSGLEPSIAASAVRRGSPPDLSHLRREFPGRARVRRLLELPEVCRSRPYVFVTHLPGVARVSEARRHLECVRLPVCGLLHSALLPNLMPSCVSLALSVEPADRLVATSRSGRAALEGLIDAGVDRLGRSAGKVATAVKSQIVEIPLGVCAPPEEALDMARARQLLLIPPDRFTVLYLGRVTEEFKADLDALLQAVGRATATGKNFQLVLAGQHQDQVYSRHVRRRVDQLGIGDRTLILDNFPDILKSSLFAACDVFVSPADSVQETFGISIIEAMAHERPVIASSWSGYRDLVRHGETGFLIGTAWSPASARIASAMACFAEPHEISHYLAQRTIVDAAELAARLDQLHADPELARRMGRAGRADVLRQYTWEHVAGRFLALWQEQAAEASRSVRPASSRLDVDRLFGHYADRPVSPEDLLLRDESMLDLTEDLSDHWSFHQERHYAELGAILDACETKPMRIGDLLARGFSMDCVLWLAKKGLCAIRPRAAARGRAEAA